MPASIINAKCLLMPFQFVLIFFYNLFLTSLSFGFQKQTCSRGGSIFCNLDSCKTRLFKKCNYVASFYRNPDETDTPKEYKDNNEERTFFVFIRKSLPHRLLLIHARQYIFILEVRSTVEYCTVSR